MANFSNYLEEALLNHVLRNSEYTRPAMVYVGLVDDTAVDTDMEAGTLTNEIDGYTGDRPSIVFTAPTQVGGKATVENTTAATEFDNMPAVTTKYVIITDSATKGGGNILVWAELTPHRTTVLGDTLRIPTGDLVIDLD